MRLFVAVWPPEEVLDLIEGLPRPALPGLRWTPRSQWHVTLQFLGELHEPPRLPRLDLDPPTATLGPASRRLGRVTALPVSGLDELAARFPQDGGRPFRGHLTIARGQAPAVACAAAWPVEEVTLVRSHLGQGPARYEVLERTPVRR